ncbi:phage collar protein [Bartonella sp. LJL80]
MTQNLLQMALQSLPFHQVDYCAFEKNQLMADGSLVPLYAPPVPLKGHFQPLPSAQKLALGLTLKSNYARFFVSISALGIASDRAQDRIAYGGRIYSVTGETDWLAQDGWKELFLTEIDES